MARATPRSGVRVVKRKRSAVQGRIGTSVAAAVAGAASAVAELPMTVIATVAPPPPPVVLLPNGPWMAADAAIVGSAHLRANPPKPCQDSALSDARGRALAVLADGAGSAAASHLGAAAVTSGVRRLCRTLEGDLAATLDADSVTPGLAEKITRQIVAHAKGIVGDLGEAHSRAPEDFRCTLLMWIAGRQRALWLKIGDGALVAEIGDECLCIGPAGKGEFANQTCFIDPRLEDRQWAWGEIDAARISGLAAMSDGASERLVASDASRVSPAIGKLLRGVAGMHVGRREIFSLLAEAEFWKGTSGDDKSLVLMARALTVEEATR